MRIDITNLRKTFDGKTVVDIPSFTINDGDLLGVVGNNGAGKTTLFRLMLDLVKADEGHIMMTFASGNSISAVDPSKNEDWKGHTGTYIDEGFLIDFLTPEEYFSFIGKVCGLSRQEVLSRLDVYAHFMNGEVLGGRKLIRNLSAGNKQKVGILAALISHPDLLVLDEPFNFLDPSSQNSLKHILTDYNVSTGATVIVSSHNLAHTIDISTRIALLEHGRVIKDLPNGSGADAGQELREYFDTER